LALALATDAILTSVRVHQGEEQVPMGSTPPVPGATLEAAGRRILRAHLGRSKQRQVETSTADRGQPAPVPLAPDVTVDTGARLFARL
jgi:hypothetical protein